MPGLFRTPLQKALGLAALGFGLAPLLFALMTLVPPEAFLPMFLASAAASSLFVFLSLFYVATQFAPQGPRGLRLLAALGLYFIPGIPLTFLVSWLRSFQGVQFSPWLTAESFALSVLAWPFMVPLMVVFTPN